MKLTAPQLLAFVKIATQTVKSDVRADDVNVLERLELVKDATLTAKGNAFLEHLKVFDENEFHIVYHCKH